MKCTILTMAMLGCAAALSGATIDNSPLLPAYKPDSEVAMEARRDGRSESPEWVKSLIMVEFRVDTAVADGTVKQLEPVLDHLAETGINGIWLTPPLNGGNGYGNHGPHTISARLVGEEGRDAQWRALRDFVDAAHRRNIRVFFDIVNWGVTKHEGGSRLRIEKPEWFGQYYPRYSGYLYNWQNRDLTSWYADQIVEWIIKTGADGFRCDCAPFYSGYEPFRLARQRLLAAGRKPVFISEHASSRRNVFDFDQVPLCYKQEDGSQQVRWVTDIYLKGNIVDMVRNGEELRMRDDYDQPPGCERFYTVMLSCHDSKRYVVDGNALVIGYQAIFAPFIPLWYIGEEWNNPNRWYCDFFQRRDKFPTPDEWSLYNTAIDWEAKERNADFFELVKKMIRIRRQHPEIFEFFPDNHRDANICKVDAGAEASLQPYARFAGGKAILVVPNRSDGNARFSVRIPFAEAGLDRNAEHVVTDLMGDRQLAAGRLESFLAEVPGGGLGVYLVAPRK